MKCGYDTEELAASTNHKGQTLRASYCKKGHWCGLVPIKLPNGRLLWPSDSIERLTTGAKGQDNAAAGVA